MVVLQAGYPKSGNLWLYRILEQILDRGGIPRRSFIQNHPSYPAALARPVHFSGQAGLDSLDIRPEGAFCKIANGDEAFAIPSMADYVRQCRHVWSHSPICDRSLGVLPEFDKVVYILRDGRDQLISAAHFAFLPDRLAVAPNAHGGYVNPTEFLAARFESGLRKWVEHVGGYLQHRHALNLHVVFYERLQYAFDDEIDALLTYLQLDLDRQARTTLRQAVDFATMHRQEGGHVRRGKVGEWHTSFTAQQKQRAQEIAGPMLHLLKYPMDGCVGIDATQLPTLPPQVRPQQIRDAMHPIRPPGSRTAALRWLLTLPYRQLQRSRYLKLRNKLA